MTIRKMLPFAAIRAARREKMNMPFSDRILYNYIHKYNYPIESGRLPMKNRKRKGKRSAPCLS